MLIIPTRHEAHLYDSSEADLAVVMAIRDALTMLADRLGDVAYNLVFQHRAPPTRRRLPLRNVHLWPKLVTVAGFEQGTV